MRTESSSGFPRAVSSVPGEGHAGVALARDSVEAAFAILAAFVGKKAKGILMASKGGERHGSTVCGVGCAGGQGDEADPSGPLVPRA